MVSYVNLVFDFLDYISTPKIPENPVENSDAMSVNGSTGLHFVCVITDSGYEELVDTNVTKTKCILVYRVYTKYIVY